MNRHQALRAFAIALLSMFAISTASSGARAITGGAAAADLSFGFIAKLDIGGVRGCTGALVAPRWIVTAASCFHAPGQSPQVGPPSLPTTAIIGRLDLTQSAGQTISVVEVLAFPGRNVALAKLARPVQNIAPVAIGTAPPAVGEQLQVAGFGRTATEWVPQRLQIATFSVESVDAGTLSILGAGQANTCKGDSGGPTLRQRAGRTELVAVTSSSWQAGCLAETDTRSGTTQGRVDDLADWIAAQPSANRRHGSIQWAMNGRCLDVLGNTKNRDPVRLWSCQPGDAADVAHDHQRWFFVNGEGRFKHRTDNHLKEPSLDFPLGSPAGTQLEIYDANDLNSQKWSLSGGMLVNGSAESPYGLACLHVPNAHFAQGVDLQFASCDGSSAQKFTLPGDGTIRPTAALNLCVDNDANVRKDANRIQLWECHGGPPQQWDLSRHGLVNEGATPGGIFGCLDRDVSRGGGPGSRAQFWTCNGQPNQAFEYLGPVLNKQNHCMDVRDRAGAAGAAIQGTSCDGTPAQLFYYTP